MAWKRRNSNLKKSLRDPFLLMELNCVKVADEKVVYFLLNKLNEQAPILKINIAPSQPFQIFLTKAEMENVAEYTI